MIFAARRGRVHAALGESIIASLPGARVGEPVTIRVSARHSIPATVSRVDPQRVELRPFTSVAGVGIGDEVVTDPLATTLPLGMRLLGRVIDPSGMPLDSRGSLRGRRSAIIDPPIDAGARAPVERPFWTGIKAIDELMTLGRGARIGIFGGPATGKSLLVETLVRGASADAVVVGLIGERGGEAAAWMQRISSHATIVCSPSDRSPAERVRAAHVALAQASQLRRRGLNVLVVLDSLARRAGCARNCAQERRSRRPRRLPAQRVHGNDPAARARRQRQRRQRHAHRNRPLRRRRRTRTAQRRRSGRARRAHHALGQARALGTLSGNRRRRKREPHDERRGHRRHRRAANIVRRAVAHLESTRELRDLGFAHSDRNLERAVALQEHIEAFIHHGTKTFGAAETLTELRALADHLDAD